MLAAHARGHHACDGASCRYAGPIHGRKFELDGIPCRVRCRSAHRCSRNRIVTLVRTGGHFPGSTALHWEGGLRGRGALFVGDSPQVATDRRRVSFMYSYPNYIPMRTSDVREMQSRLAPFEYDDVYGYSWGRNIIGSGQAAVNASFERFFSAVTH